MRSPPTRPISFASRTISTTCFEALPELEAQTAPAGAPGLERGLLHGEEPYTLAMVLSEYAEAGPGSASACWRPISRPKCWPKPAGIFKSEAVRPLPPKLRKKYFMRSRDPESDLVRVVPELRALIEFRRLNFMDADFGLAERRKSSSAATSSSISTGPRRSVLLEKLSATCARRIFLRGAFRVASEYGPASGFRAGPAVYRKCDMMTAPPKYSVQPGELYLARKPAILRTILGSCVSVTFWSARLGAGALCHGVLPRCPAGATGPRRLPLRGFQHSLPGGAVRRAGGRRTNWK
jgi:hypothetical protein